MSHASVQIIRNEHRALQAMLRSTTLLIELQRERGTAPAFDVLRAMLFYIDEFPERLHHPKESELLFPLLRQRASEVAGDVLARLDREHQQGEQAIRDLQHALLAWELLGESRREAFESRLARYQAFYLAHMRLEEEVILPLAEQLLTPVDWTALDEAFATNRDPFAGHPAEGEYERLFSKIVNSAPAPVGLGAAA